MEYKAVLFDFDGVVVDSMHQHYQAWSKTFAEHNIRFSKHEFFQLEGQGAHTIAAILGERYGLNKDAAINLVTQKVKFYYQDVSIKFYDHIFELLSLLKEQNIPMCVVTGGYRKRVEEVVNMHFKDTFKHIISIDDVTHGKPHPEPFLKGAAKLGFSGEECIVVENAPLGIQAAKAAGCTVLAVETTLNSADLQQADYVYPNFKTLISKMEALIAH